MNDWSINATLGYIFVLLYYFFNKFLYIFFESPLTRNFRYKMMNDWSTNATLGYIFVLLY